MTTDSSILTASANDFGFEGVFERQVQALGKPGDVVVGISTSGNSENVARALAYATAHGMPGAISLTGASGGRISELASVAIRGPGAPRATHSRSAYHDRPHSLRPRRTLPLPRAGLRRSW